MNPNRVIATTALRGLGLLSQVAPQACAALALRVMTAPRRRSVFVEQPDRQWRTPTGLRVHEWGDQGPTVICLHGWESDGLQFASLATYLRARGWRVLAPDARAHGQSPGRRATMLDLFEALKETHALMAQEPVRVIGHSMGAAAVMLALRQGIDFSRTVLISGPTVFGEVFARYNSAVGLSARCYASIVQRMEGLLGCRMDHLDMIANPPSGPALLIHDSQDKEIPLQASMTLASVWPEAQLWVTHGLGHRRLLNDEAVCARVAHYLGAPGAAPATAQAPAGDLRDPSAGPATARAPAGPLA